MKQGSGARDVERVARRFLVTASTTTTVTIRVLIVDDHPLLREGVAMMLSAGPDFEVVGAVGTAREALAEVARLEPDVAIIDLTLPDGDGIDVCARIQAEHPRVRLLVLTRTQADRFVMNAFRAGAHGFVVKTADPSEMVHAVRAVASDETYVDPRVAHCIVKAATRGRTARGPFGLTGQELHVMELVHLNLSNHQIACQLGLSVETVKTHLRHAMQKLGVDDRWSAVRVLTNEGLL